MLTSPNGPLLSVQAGAFLEVWLAYVLPAVMDGLSDAEILHDLATCLNNPPRSDTPTQHDFQSICSQEELRSRASPHECVVELS